MRYLQQNASHLSITRGNTLNQLFLVHKSGIYCKYLWDDGDRMVSSCCNAVTVRDDSEQMLQRSAAEQQKFDSRDNYIYIVLVLTSITASDSFPVLVVYYLLQIMSVSQFCMQRIAL